jgi:mRNA interferase MazF
MIPLTTDLIEDVKPLRLRLKAEGDLERDSDLMINQIRAIDNRRLLKCPLLQVDEEFLKRIYSAIGEVMGIV